MGKGLVSFSLEGSKYGNDKLQSPILRYLNSWFLVLEIFCSNFSMEICAGWENG